MKVPTEGDGRAPGQSIALSVRPEAVRLDRAPGTTGLAGTVAEIVYLGSSVRVGVRLSSGQLVWADLRDEEAEGLDVGAAVSLSWVETAATIVEDK